jgi:phospholipase/carboxylesterase
MSGQPMPPSGDLVHLLREPAGDPEGALILNHGRGSDERDLFDLLDEFDPERRLLGVSTGAPLTGIPPGGRHWYLVDRVGYPHADTFHASYERLTEHLDRLLAERRIGWDRAVIGGFSMGAVMSYAVGLGPGRPSPAGILALSGFIPTVEGWHPELAGRESLPVLIHHGRNDPVISVEFARRARDVLGAAGLGLDYVETDAGHWVPPEVIPRARALVAGAVEPAGIQAPPPPPG